MKRYVLFHAVWIWVVLSSHAWAQFPLHLGGFILGEDISEYAELVRMDTCREMSRTPYLAEGEITPRQGFRSGMISYGVCDRPNKILKIKLKFEDDSKSFFKKLMDAYTEKFGPPGEYKGDPFQTMVIWKWSFANAEGERISLILQHNKMVEEEKKGTAVKMALTTQIEKEKACYLKVQNKRVAPAADQGKTLSNKEMWDLFIPR